ncbi:MAG TPA: GspH/FimT family pseudopilin [Vicinamibacterales bacterium]|jgi:type II secretory pathway pseudopilin PulG|nr:GspH/FimT family pseudopilin [Vicinamibacterales bacterium]
MVRGYSLLEVLLALAFISIVAGTAIPLALSSLDQSRTAAAAAYISSRLMEARFEAVKRSAFVGVQFVRQDDGYWFQTYVDGNGNGVLAGDISLGIDRPLGPAEQLEQRFAGVTFGICPNVTAVMPGYPFNPDDPIQIGPSTVMSFSPNGSSTAGTVYIRGLNLTQFAVTVSGITAQSRIRHFDFGNGQWRN